MGAKTIKNIVIKACTNHLKYIEKLLILLLRLKMQFLKNRSMTLSFSWVAKSIFKRMVIFYKILSTGNQYKTKNHQFR